MKEKTAPAFAAIHSASADEYEGEMPTWKQLKAEVHKLAADDGDAARFIANIYKILAPRSTPKAT